MQNQHKTGLIFLIGILTGVVLILLFIVFKGNNITILPLSKENEKTYSKRHKTTKVKTTDNTIKTTKIFCKGKQNQYSSLSNNEIADNTEKQDKKTFEKNIFVIDLNTADTLDLQLIRGVGKVFAKRIYNYGKRLGGYHDKNQLKEVKGINDTVFEKISSQIVLQDSNLRKIDINTDNIKTLYYHPYIDYYLAKAIIEFRKQYGNFSTIEEVKKVHLMDEKTFQRLAPYIEVRELSK